VEKHCSQLDRCGLPKREKRVIRGAQSYQTASKEGKGTLIQQNKTKEEKIRSEEARRWGQAFAESFRR